MNGSSNLRLYHLAFEDEEGLSLRVLLRRRAASERAMINAPSAVLRVRNSNSSEVIRQDGTRRCEIIIAAILDHANLTTDLRIMAKRRLANALRYQASRADRRVIVNSLQDLNMVATNVGHVRQFTLRLARCIERVMVTSINSNNARVNGLREDRIRLALSSESASSNRSIPKALMDLIVRLYVEGRASLLTQRVSTRLVTRSRARRVIFPCNRHLLRQTVLLLITCRMVGSPTRMAITKDASNVCRHGEQQITVASRVRAFMERAVVA